MVFLPCFFTFICTAGATHSEANSFRCKFFLIVNSACSAHAARALPFVGCDKRKQKHACDIAVRKW